MPIVFDLVYWIAALTIGPFWLAQRFIRGKPLAPLVDRLFRFPRMSADSDVAWVHGVSVGEILAARGLVRSLGEAHPDLVFVISTTTTAGHAVALREFPGHTVCYCPLDFSWSVRRAIRGINPSLVILMELELWPNLLHCLAVRKIPVVIANGKISPGSLAGYRKLRWISPGFLKGVSVFCVQDEAYGALLGELQVDPERVSVTGSLKADNLPEQPDSSMRESLRMELGIARDAPTLVAGSTHEGEETLVLGAFRSLLETIPGIRLVIAPRHLERLASIEKEIVAGGFVPQRRTAAAAGSVSSTTVILLDTMGELADLFSTADVVLLGGTFVPVGGHNILEPAALGCPVVLGPHISTIQRFAREMMEVGGALQASDESGLVAILSPLLLDPVKGEQAGARARSVVDRHRGATRRTLEAVEEVMDSCARDRR